MLLRRLVCVVYLCKCVCIYICMCMYACMQVRVCMHTCKYVYVCMYAFVYMYVCSCVHAYENSGMYHRLCSCTKAPDPPKPKGTVIGCRGDGFAWYCGHASILGILIVYPNDMMYVCSVHACRHECACMGNYVGMYVCMHIDALRVCVQL